MSWSFTTFLACIVSHVAAFSNESPAPAFTLSDRFKASCPCDLSSISQFDPSLISTAEMRNDNDESQQGTWVAVFRSNNNMPSVLVKDDFLNAMRIATNVQGNTLDNKGSGDDAFQSTTVASSSIPGQIETSTGTDSKNGESSGVKARTPVAIAQLSKSTDFPDQWVIKTMRCSLKKENTDDTCDGNSEHAEAIGVCIDELILHYLRQGLGQFNGSIRCKATLVSGILLEERGFQEVTTLSKDMATHTSNVGTSMEKYAERSVATVARSPGARDRSLQILSFLGRLDEDEVNKNDEDDTDEEEYDPWASANIF